MRNLQIPPRTILTRSLLFLTVLMMSNGCGVPADRPPRKPLQSILSHYDDAGNRSAEIVETTRGAVLEEDASKDIDRRWCVAVKITPAEGEEKLFAFWLAERVGDAWEVRQIGDNGTVDVGIWQKFECPGLHPPGSN